MKFEFKDIDIELTWHEWEGDSGFNGFAKIQQDDGTYTLHHMKNGWNHKDLGPAMIIMPAGVESYWQDGYSVSDLRQHWKDMYIKYKGTEHEELCLSQMLANEYT